MTSQYLWACSLQNKPFKRNYRLKDGVYELHTSHHRALHNVNGNTLNTACTIEAMKKFMNTGASGQVAEEQQVDVPDMLGYLGCRPGQDSQTARLQIKLSVGKDSLPVISQCVSKWLPAGGQERPGQLGNRCGPDYRLGFRSRS